MTAPGTRRSLRLGACVILLAACHTPPTKPAGPNLLLITVDTLRADHLGCYGYGRDTTPTLDGLAREGTRFDRAYAQRGSTWPSLASILTAQYPLTHGVRTNGQRLPAAATTLADVLTPRGWHAGAVLTNTGDQDWHGFSEKIEVPNEPQDANATAEALRWIQAFPTEPFFLWVHYVAPHDPYRPPQEFRRFDPDYTGPATGDAEYTTGAMIQQAEPSDADVAHVVSLYDGEVAWTDSLIRPVLDALSAKGVLDRTLVVATSDHGEELYDHRRYFFHNCSVYEPVLRIPVVMRQPGAIPAGEVVPDIVQSIDLAPTILELLGVPVPSTFEGRSLVPLLRGDALPAQPAFSELEDRVLTVRTPRWRYIFNPNAYLPPLVPQVALQMSHTEAWAHRNRFLLDREELYDVRKDPRETWNLALRPHEASTEMRVVLDTFQKEHGWRFGSEVEAQSRMLDGDTRHKLEKLGYAQPDVANRSSLRFDGVDDLVRIDHLVGLDGDGWTIQAWIRPEKGAQPKPNLLARRDPKGGRDTFTFRVRQDMGGVLELGLASGGQEWGTAGSSAIPFDTWTAVAASWVRATSTVRFFVNGIPEGERRAPFAPGTGDVPTWIGGDPLRGPTERPFKGWIDEVRIWDRVLPPDALVKRPLRGDEPGLLFHADMEEGEGQQAGRGTGSKGILGLTPEPDASDPTWADQVPSP